MLVITGQTRQQKTLHDTYYNRRYYTTHTTTEDTTRHILQQKVLQDGVKDTLATAGDHSAT